ncbi:MAG: LTA synthase family protein [Rhodanobacteraceae bacterium]|nr:LTA synthase family protein [Rhodanobacteraceae bacterium]
MSKAKRFLDWAFAGPYRLLLQLTLTYAAFNLLVRMALGVYNGDAGIFWSGRIVGALLVGAVFDVGVAVFMMLPILTLLMLLRSSRHPRLDYVGQRLIAWSLLPFAGMLVFVAAAEFVFWNEFASRFNFIAVDYLVYTNEVIGNIRESYPMPLLLSGVAVSSGLLWLLIIRITRGALAAPPPTWRGRLARSAVWLLLPLISYGLLDERYKEFSDDAQANELAGNGAFDFFHAYQTNEIDYERFYTTMPDAQALAGVRSALHLPGKAQAAFDIGRQINPPAPEHDWNVVLVSIESLSASYLEHFGNRGKLTPNLDRMADEGLLFTQLYATGTRTVRGLEALTLSVPPTPGHSIVKRPNNEALYSLGSVFAQKGYAPLYIYGGYSYFDNMQAFFQGNGYRVVDRTDLASDEIHFQNIWGVCDEDLFTLALREIDREAARGKPFFAHVMTVSNHRPFTYPEGRIDIPSKTGRDGGAKYTDWAIGDFVRRARQKPWFDHTVFVFVADHTHRGRGKMDLAPRNYLIPLIVWAPGKIQPGRVEQLASQIDVAPTLLGLMNMRYESHFYGSDILAPGAAHRALLANYQTVGWYQDGLVVELKPGARTRVVDASTGLEQAPNAASAAMTAAAISYYQLASESFGSGAMKLASQQETGAVAGAARAP